MTYTSRNTSGRQNKVMEEHRNDKHIRKNIR